MYLSDDDPEWEKHSGGDGHAGPEWTKDDVETALIYWDAMDDKGRAILRYLFRRRGHQVHNSELVRELGFDPEGNKMAPQVMAASLRGMRNANKATRHRFPFRWWEREGGAVYAVRTSTADIFERALFAAHAQQGRGEALAFRLSTGQVQPFIQRLEGTTHDADVRMVLGSACTTATKAVQQFVAALQLPYEAANGWRKFLDHLGEWPASLRQCIVVTDACQMLKHEDADLWRAGVAALHSGPPCTGGGWSTLVLVDDEFGWDDWVFESATDIHPPR